MKLARRYQVRPDVAECLDADCTFESRGELSETFADEHVTTTGHVVRVTSTAAVTIGPAAGQLTETAESRQAAIDVPPPAAAALRIAHFAVPCPLHDDGKCMYTPISCNSACWLPRDVLATTVTGDVTCKRCQRTTPYLDALAQEVAAR